MQQDTIYQFSWIDQHGKPHSISVVGIREYNDQVAYLNTLETAGLITNAEVHQDGKDI